MASLRTGGAKTDEALGKNGSGPEGLPHSIIVTVDGVEGEVPEPVEEEAVEGDSTNGASAGDDKRARGKRTRGKSAAPRRAGQPAPKRAAGKRRTR
jgi:DNA topoisomerase-6 subunit B